MIPDSSQNIERNPLLSATPLSSKVVFSQNLSAPELSISESTTSESSLSETPDTESYTLVSSTVVSSVVQEIALVSQSVNNLLSKVCDAAFDVKTLSLNEMHQTHSSEFNSLNHILVSELKTFYEIL